MAKLQWRAVGAELRKLRENPADIEAGARLFLALGGKDDARALSRLRNSERGRRLLSERPDLLGALTDRERLRALPDGTLGREYLRFAEREQIFPEGLEEMMTRVQGVPEDGDVAYLRTRERSLHDLLHVLTGSVVIPQAKSRFSPSRPCRMARAPSTGSRSLDARAAVGIPSRATDGQRPPRAPTLAGAAVRARRHCGPRSLRRVLALLPSRRLCMPFGPMIRITSSRRWTLPDSPL